MPRVLILTIVAVALILCPRQAGVQGATLSDQRGGCAVSTASMCMAAGHGIGPLSCMTPSNLTDACRQTDIAAPTILKLLVAVALLAIALISDTSNDGTGVRPVGFLGWIGTRIRHRSLRSVIVLS